MLPHEDIIALARYYGYSEPVLPEVKAVVSQLVWDNICGELRQAIRVAILDADNANVHELTEVNMTAVRNYCSIFRAAAPPHKT